MIGLHGVGRNLIHPDGSGLSLSGRPHGPESRAEKDLSGINPDSPDGSGRTLLSAPDLAAGSAAYTNGYIPVPGGSG